MSWQTCFGRTSSTRWHLGTPTKGWHFSIVVGVSSRPGTLRHFSSLCISQFTLGKIIGVLRHFLKKRSISLLIFMFHNIILRAMFGWEGVGTSKITSSKGQNIESLINLIRTSKVKKIRTSKVFSECRKSLRRKERRKLDFRCSDLIITSKVYF